MTIPNSFYAWVIQQPQPRRLELMSLHLDAQMKHLQQIQRDHRQEKGE